MRRSSLNFILLQTVSKKVIDQASPGQKQGACGHLMAGFDKKAGSKEKSKKHFTPVNKC